MTDDTLRPPPPIQLQMSRGPSLVWMPVLCFQCGLPIQRMQHVFEATVGHPDGHPRFVQRLYDALGVANDCCRVVLSRSAVEPRLVTPVTVPLLPSSFTTIHRSSKADAQPVTMPTTGATAVLHGMVAPPP
jgi:DNA-directed RNA polymerase subunit N (RpoN/RPB10)